ncbi:MAG: M48 family peptidase, partial [Betaproteobacteria bacterium]|nr:M48 family peptidase [Betaproteobacteria bacterium]
MDTLFLNDCWGQWPRDRIAARIEVPTEVPTELRAKVRAKIRALYWIASCLIAFTALAPGCVQATEGTDQTPPKSKAINLVSAEEIERSAQAQYQQLLQQAAAKDALASPDHLQLRRLHRIAERIIPHAAKFNVRAPQWRWEVNLIGSNQINAFCMPGGKIAFYSGIIQKLKLTDDEVAMVMGHEIAHALQEHGRERVGKARVAQALTLGASVLSHVMGYGDLGGQLVSGGSQLALLKFSREDETEADRIGMEIAARAGYDPRGAAVLWEKMAAIGKGQPPQWLSTHPSHDAR